MIDPLTNPAAADRITLDGEEVPLYAELTSGGERKLTVEQQQSPGYAGYRTIVKAAPPPTLVYRFHLWESKHFKAFRPWLEKFKTAMTKRRPPRVFVLGDSAVEHNEIGQVICSGVSPRIKVARGHYAYDVTFDEYKKPRPIGGVAVPEKTATDTATEAEIAAGAELRQALEGFKKAEASGEGVGAFDGLLSLFGSTP